MVGWHHQLNGHGFGWTPAVGDGQRGSWGRKESDTTEQLNCTSHLYVFFGETSVWVFSPLFDWVVCISGIELYELLVYFGN